jgi:hypothetical protein
MLLILATRSLGFDGLYGWPLRKIVGVPSIFAASAAP